MIRKSDLLSKMTLLKVLKRFSKRPKKIFLNSDFQDIHGGKFHLFSSRYLNTLISLNLIEEVDSIFKTGMGLKGVRNVRGYRLINGTKRISRKKNNRLC